MEAQFCCQRSHKSFKVKQPCRLFPYWEWQEKMSDEVPRDVSQPLLLKKTDADDDFTVGFYTAPAKPNKALVPAKNKALVLCEGHASCNFSLYEELLRSHAQDLGHDITDLEVHSLDPDPRQQPTHVMGVDHTGSYDAMTKLAKNNKFVVIMEGACMTRQQLPEDTSFDEANDRAVYTFNGLVQLRECMDPGAHLLVKNCAWAYGDLRRRNAARMDSPEAHAFMKQRYRFEFCDGMRFKDLNPRGVLLDELHYVVYRAVE